jgi:hypothetical protein
VTGVGHDGSLHALVSRGSGSGSVVPRGIPSYHRFAAESTCAPRNERGGRSMVASFRWRALVVGAVLILGACGSPEVAEGPTEPIEGTGTFVGAVHQELFIAIAAAEHPDSEVERAYYAYLCDNADRSTWLLLESDGDDVVLEADDVSVTLSVAAVQRLADGADVVSGEVSIAGEPTRSFTAERAEGEGGLYRVERVGPPHYTGGWIILNSGHQVGAVTTDGVVVDNPILDVATGTAESSVVTLTNISQLPCIPVPRFGCIPLPR